MAKTKLTVFTLPDCPKCPAAKKLVERVGKDMGIDIDEINLKEDMITGLQYGVASAPSVAVNERIISRGEVPDREVLIAQIKRVLK